MVRIFYTIEKLFYFLIIEYLRKNNILKNTFQCPKCDKFMKMVANQNYADGKLWRCRANTSYHDVKYNIRKESILEKTNLPLQVIYFLTFIEKSYIEISNNKNLIDNHTVSKESISNLYQILRNKIVWDYRSYNQRS